MRNEMIEVIRGNPIHIGQFYSSLPPAIKAHSESVANITARLLNWAIDDAMEEAVGIEIETVRRAALYHDIGFVLIPEKIIFKREDISGAEYRVLQQHALYGATLLSDYCRQQQFNSVEAAFWELAAEIAVGHHERWDGKGYPYGQRTTATLIAARATAIACAYDSMVRGNYYCDPLPFEYVFLEIIQNAGKQFDPDLSEIFRHHYDELIADTTTMTEYGG